MSLRQWAIKPRELAPLSQAGRVLFSARCAMRIEDWLPPGASARKLWKAGLATLVDAALVPREKLASRSLQTQARDLGDCGAIACNERDGTPDETNGRCMNYATQTLATALSMLLIADDAKRSAELINLAKYSASIGALLAHAGLVRAPAGRPPVDFACELVWDAIRADVAMLVDAADGITSAKRPVDALRAIAPLWPSGPIPLTTRGKQR